MSADNWEICPRCVKQAKDALTDKTIEVGRMYGKVPMEEYEAARKAAAAEGPIDPEKFRTFREDYEFYGANTGEVVAEYSGHCSVCGLGVDFKHEHRFWSVDRGEGSRT